MTAGQKGAPIIRTLALLMRSPGSLRGAKRPKCSPTAAREQAKLAARETRHYVADPDPSHPSDERRFRPV